MALVSLEDYEKKAAEIIPGPAWGYYSSGAGQETSLKWNREAFQR